MPAEGDLAAAPFPLDTWDGALIAEGGLIRGLDSGSTPPSSTPPTALRDDRRRALLVGTGVPVAILLLALLVAGWSAGRSPGRATSAGAASDRSGRAGPTVGDHRPHKNGRG